MALQLVILSEAKNLLLFHFTQTPRSQILRCAQDDRRGVQNDSPVEIAEALALVSA
jgi:hypothetical protein